VVQPRDEADDDKSLPSVPTLRDLTTEVVVKQWSVRDRITGEELLKEEETK
jgi:hypothetical protein